MGTWGPQLYQDDIAEHIKLYYDDQLRRGKTNAEISNALIENYYSALDFDDAIVFWLALADTQWNLGRLEDHIKNEALRCLKNGGDIVRWMSENSNDVVKRKHVLHELEKKLLSPQPTESKIQKYRLYKCEWKKGDVYAYPLLSNYAKEKKLYNRYFLIHKIGETYCYPGHIIPIVRIKIADLVESLSEMDFDRLEYVQTSATNYSERFLPFDASRPIESQIEERSRLRYEPDEFGFLPQYRIALISTSKRIIPDNLIYVGNFQNIKPPDIEFVPHNDENIPHIAWRFFEKIIIDRYCGYNLREFDIYK